MRLSILLFALLPFAAIAETPPTAPLELKVETLAHGPYDLGARRGEWVLVNFWATWCAPCLKEMPELDAFDRERADASVIGLAYEETTVEDLKTFLEQRPVTYPIALVDVFNPPQGWETPRGLPLSLLIDPQGALAKKFLGPVTAKELQAAMAAHAK